MMLTTQSLSSHSRICTLMKMKEATGLVMLLLVLLGLVLSEMRL